MRRSTKLWITAAAVLVVAFAATVIALNATVYSAGGFVRAYLTAVSEHDASGALSLPGVSATGERELLESDAMGELSGIRLVSDEANGPNLRTVVFEVELASGTELSEFSVERTGNAWGVFQQWRFATTPLATIEVDVTNADSFTANGRAVSTDGSFLVFTPGSYVLDHVSRVLDADAVTVTVPQPAAVARATVDAQATAEFETAVQAEVERLLDECASRRVLQPAGCPFGASIKNRVEGEPRWSVSRYPRVELERAGADWVSNNAEGVADLRATVRSLFDGSVDEVRSAVPFDASYRVRVSGESFTVELD